MASEERFSYTWRGSPAVPPQELRDSIHTQLQVVASTSDEQLRWCRGRFPVDEIAQHYLTWFRSSLGRLKDEKMLSTSEETALTNLHDHFERMLASDNRELWQDTGLDLKEWQLARALAAEAAAALDRQE